MSRPREVRRDVSTRSEQGRDPPPHTHTDAQTPGRRPCGRYSALNNGDSPGDEASQDIIWDPTSPTQPHAGKGPKVTRAVLISDIAKRIAPKDARPAVSPLLQWIGDNAVLCTPEARPPRARRRSVRRSSVDGLIELARQFDRNMERSDALANGPRHHGDPSASPNAGAGAAAAAVSPPAPRRPSESQQAEAELQALFDGSTQGASGPLSQRSATPSPLGGGCGAAAAAAARPPESGGVGVSARGDVPAEDVAARGPVEEFDDDDWENDDLLNDSLVIAMTNEAEPPPPPRPLPKTTTSGVTASSGGVCPRPKHSQRSTFKLEPNPRYVSPPASTNHTPEHLHTAKPVETQTPVAIQSVTMVTAVKPVTAAKPAAALKPVAMKSVATAKPQSSETLGAAARSDSGADSRDLLNPDRTPGCLDSSWDEGGDDQLLFQVCDDVEKLSSSQPTPATPSEGRRNATAPVAIGSAARPGSAAAAAARQLACGYVRSNSVPGTGGVSVSYQGWSVQMKGGRVAAQPSALSQSHPGSHVGLGTLSRFRDASTTFQESPKTGAGVPPRTVTARPPGNSKSHHATFKRFLPDSAVVGSKAPVGGHGNTKCSAAEIERKKQEALARKRQRMHNSQKHEECSSDPAPL